MKRQQDSNTNRVGALLMILGAIQQAGPDLIPEQYLGVVMSIIGVVMIVLRQLTHQGVRGFKNTLPLLLLLPVAANAQTLPDSGGTIVVEDSSLVITLVPSSWQLDSVQVVSAADGSALGSAYLTMGDTLRVGARLFFRDGAQPDPDSVEVTFNTVSCAYGSEQECLRDSQYLEVIPEGDTIQGWGKTALLRVVGNPPDSMTIRIAVGIVVRGLRDMVHSIQWEMQQVNPPRRRAAVT